MKQLFSVTLLLAFAILLTSSSCKKQNTGPQLPPETQTGANTLGFKIDGKIYTASGKSGLLANQFVWANGPFLSDTSIIIAGQNRDQKFDFRIVIKYTGSFGIHYTSAYPYEGVLQLNADGTVPNASDIYQTNQIFKGKVNIKFTDAMLTPLKGITIVAGTFEMEAINSEGKIIKITDGRFDIGR